MQEYKAYLTTFLGKISELLLISDLNFPSTFDPALVPLNVPVRKAVYLTLRLDHLSSPAGAVSLLTPCTAVTR